MTGFTPEEWRTAARVARRSIFTEGNPDLADAWDKAADQVEARLIPDGGMALTAEQVEDVRIVLGLNGSQDIKVVLDAQARLRALFPATEPTEEVKPVKFRKMTAKYATANFGFPDVTDPFTRWAYKDSDGDKWAWNGDQWELHVVLPDSTEERLARNPETLARIKSALASTEGDTEIPAPAEPAEEVTRAEDEANLAARAEGWYEGYEVGLEYGPIAASGEEYDGPINPYDVPASSPVVPAPTETEAGHA